MRAESSQLHIFDWYGLFSMQHLFYSKVGLWQLPRLSPLPLHFLRINCDLSFSWLCVKQRLIFNLKDRVQDTRASNALTPLLVPKVLRLVLWYEFLAMDQRGCSRICLCYACNVPSYSQPSRALTLLLSLLTQLLADASMHVSGIICKLAYDKNIECHHH